jgi:RHS repeat-associated protein
MAFWVVVAQIVKIILTVRKYAALLSALTEGKLVEGLIESFIVGSVTDGLIKSGVPLDKIDLKGQAEEWLNQIVNETAGDLAKHGLVLAPDRLQLKLNTYLDELLSGAAVADAPSAHRNQAFSADPVNLARGEFERTRTDFEVRGAGMDFVFSRTYRSGAGYLGPLGPAWDHAYNLRLREESEFSVVRLTGELSEDRFVKHPRFAEAAFAYYAPPDGVHDVIVPDGLGSFLLRRPLGTVFRFEQAADPLHHRIRRIEDRFGNFLHFDYGADEQLGHVLVNSSSRHVTFSYDEAGRLSALADHTGRHVTYGYDDHGYLEWVRGPAATGGPPLGYERYEYDEVGQSFRLARVWDWKGRIVVENEYERDPLSEFFGYIVRQTENRGEWTFSYHPIVGGPVDGQRVEDGPTLRVWESRRNGHQVEHVFNEVGNQLITRERYVEGCGIRESTTRFRYNVDGQLISRIDAEGAATQYLYYRDHLSDVVAWPEVGVVLGDVPLHERMNFGALLATVVRGRRVSPSVDFEQPDFWNDAVAAVKQPDHADDQVIKFRHDPETQLLLSTSDPRHTRSADPEHVESAVPGNAAFDPDQPDFIAHQRHLTRYEYGPAPRSELQRTVWPDRTRPSTLDGMDMVSPVVEEVRLYDARGRVRERVDARGYDWFDEYFPSDAAAREGFSRRRLAPHADLEISQNTPDILEIRTQGQWQRLPRCWRSSGAVGDAIAIAVEGVRIALYQPTDAVDGASAHTEVTIRVDDTSHPPWNQSVDSTYIVADLIPGDHRVELIDESGMPFSLGWVRSHVAEEIDVDELGGIIETRGSRTHAAFELDAAGHIVRTTEGSAQNPRITEAEYDPAGLLVREKTVWKDETGQLRPGLAAITALRYDQGSLVCAESVRTETGDPARTTWHGYDTQDNLCLTTNARGNRTAFGYDALDRHVYTVWGACSADCAMSRSRYDRAGHLVEERNPRGAVRLKGSIDPMGRARVDTDPLGHRTVTRFDRLDNPVTVWRFQRRQDAAFELLSRRTADYDESGGLVRQTDARFDTPILTADPIDAPDAEFLEAVDAGSVETAVHEYHLDAHGHVVGERDPAGGIHRRRFDGQGRLYDEIDAEGRRRFSVFDGDGNVRRIYAFEPVRDPLTNDLLRYDSFVQTHEHDELRRQTARIDAYGNRWEMRYDTLDHQTVAIDPLGNVVRKDFNVFGEEVGRIQERTASGLGDGPALPPITNAREYDGAGNVTAMIDGRSNRIEFRHDARERLVETWFASDPALAKERRRYDGANNLVRIEQRNGIVRTLQYDLLDRHVRTDIDLLTLAPGQPLSSLSSTFLAFAYDAAANRIRHENDYCLVEVSCNSRGEPLLERVTFTALPDAPPPLEIIRSFDAAGRRNSLHYPSGRIVTFAHDALGRVLAIHNAAAPIDYPGRPSNGANFELARFRYAGRRLISLTMGNGLVVHLRFDGRGHLVERELTGAGGTLWRWQSLRDAAGFTRLETSITRTSSRSRKIWLDSLYRLVQYQDGPSLWVDASVVAPPAQSLDPAQSIGQGVLDAAMGPLAIDASTPAFVYDAAGNRLQTTEPGMPPQASVPDDLNQYVTVAGASWQHDREGNLQADGQHAFLYDANGRLQEVRDGVTNATLVTFFRDALDRVITEVTPGGTRFRVYDGPMPLLELRGDGRTEFVPGQRPDAALHAAQGGEDYWIGCDSLMSLRTLSDGAGEVVAMPTYRPYGATEDEELASSPLRFGFAGMWYTAGLPLLHSERRAYRPDVGRHLQRDPAGFLDGLNSYLYVGNNPFHDADPTGLNPLAKAAKKGLNWVADKGKTVHGHAAKRHAFGGIGRYKRLSNSIPDLRARTAMLNQYAAKSTLRNPEEGKKLVEATLKKFHPEHSFIEGANAVFQRAFGRMVGRQGETTFRVVVERATGKIVTYFPQHTFKTLVAAGAGVLLTFESGVVEASELGETERAKFNAANQPGTLETLNEWLNPLSGLSEGQGASWLSQANPDRARKISERMIRTMESEMKAPLSEEARTEIHRAVLNAYTGSLPEEDVMLDWGEPPAEPPDRPAGPDPFRNVPKDP